MRAMKKLWNTIFRYKRKTFDPKHILSLCEQGDYGILSPPMNAQTAVNELCHYFLGDDWYDTSGASNNEQVNTNIVATIEQRYKGCWVKKNNE